MPKEPLDLDTLDPMKLARALGRWTKIRESLDMALHYKSDIQASCRLHGMRLMECYHCSGSREIAKEIATVDKKLRGIRFLLRLCKVSEETGNNSAASIMDEMAFEAKLAKIIAKVNSTPTTEQRSYSAMDRGNKRPIAAKVRAVHTSKRGQVNYNELGAGRYNTVINWGRKFNPATGGYEKI